MKNKHKSGFSLLEATIVLSIVGVALGGVWAVVSSIRDAVLARQLVDRYVTIANNIRAYNATRPLTSNLTTYFDSTGTGTLTANILPDEMCNATCLATAGAPINFPFKTITRQNFSGYTERFNVGTSVSMVSSNITSIEAVFVYNAASPSGPVSLFTRGGCLRFLAELDARAQDIGLSRIILSVTTPATSLSRTYPGTNVAVASDSTVTAACQAYATSTSAKSLQVNFRLWPRGD